MMLHRMDLNDSDGFDMPLLLTFATFPSLHLPNTKGIIRPRIRYDVTGISTQ
jgi:hypothetical protein